MAFHDVELPPGFQYRSIVGAGFGTIIQETASGHEYRVARQSQGRHRYRLMADLRTDAEAQALKTFALGRRGAYHSFKLKDWSDYTTNADGKTAPSNTDQIIGVGDGSTRTFQLQKLYDPSGDDPYSRAITLPKSGTVVCAVGGSGTTAFTVNASGIVNFTTAPSAAAVITAGCEFYVPVRFSSDFDQWAQLQADAFNTWSLPNLDCIEVLNEVEMPERWKSGGGTNWGSVGTNISITLADGMLQHLTPTANISIILPSTARIPSGGRVFVVSIPVTSTHTVQMRYVDGTALGAAFGNGGAVKQIGLTRTASGATWVLY